MVKYLKENFFVRYRRFDSFARLISYWSSGWLTLPTGGNFASSGRHRNSASRRNRSICSRCRIRTSIPATSISVMSHGMAISRLAETVTACRKACVASRYQYGFRWMMNCGSTVMSSRWHRTVSVRLHPAGRPCRSITPRSGSRSVRWNPKSDLFNKAAPNHHSKIFRHGTSAASP